MFSLLDVAYLDSAAGRGQGGKEDTVDLKTTLLSIFSCLLCSAWCI